MSSATTLASAENIILNLLRDHAAGVCSFVIFRFPATPGHDKEGLRRGWKDSPGPPRRRASEQALPAAPQGAGTGGREAGAPEARPCKRLLGQAQEASPEGQDPHREGPGAGSSPCTSGHANAAAALRRGAWPHAGRPGVEALIWKTMGVTCLTSNKLGTKTGEDISDSEPSSTRLNTEETQTGRRMQKHRDMNVHVNTHRYTRAVWKRSSQKRLFSASHGRILSRQPVCFLALSTKEPGSSNTPVAMNTLSVQVLASQHHTCSMERNQKKQPIQAAAGKTGESRTS